MFVEKFGGIVEGNWETIVVDGKVRVENSL